MSDSEPVADATAAPAANEVDTPSSNEIQRSGPPSDPVAGETSVSEPPEAETASPTTSADSNPAVVVLSAPTPVVSAEEKKEVSTEEKNDGKRMGIPTMTREASRQGFGRDLDLHSPLDFLNTSLHHPHGGTQPHHGSTATSSSPTPASPPTAPQASPVVSPVTSPSGPPRAVSNADEEVTDEGGDIEADAKLFSNRTEDNFPDITTIFKELQGRVDLTAAADAVFRETLTAALSTPVDADVISKDLGPLINSAHPIQDVIDKYLATFRRLSDAKVYALIPSLQIRLLHLGLFMEDLRTFLCQTYASSPIDIASVRDGLQRAIVQRMVVALNGPLTDMYFSLHKTKDKKMLKKLKLLKRTDWTPFASKDGHDSVKTGSEESEPVGVGEDVLIRKKYRLATSLIGGDGLAKQAGLGALDGCVEQLKAITEQPNPCVKLDMLVAMVDELNSLGYGEVIVRSQQGGAQDAAKWTLPHPQKEHNGVAAALAYCVVLSQLPKFISEATIMYDFLSEQDFQTPNHKRVMALSKLSGALDLLASLRFGQGRNNFDSLTAEECKITHHSLPSLSAKGYLTVSVYTGMEKELQGSLSALLHAEKSDNTDWKLQSKDKKTGIQVFTQPGKHDKRSFMKAVGIVPASMNDLVVRISVLSQRGTYDSLYESGNVVEDIDENTRVTHVVYKALPLRAVRSRDFVVLEHKTLQDDGSWVSLGLSVKDRRMPPATKRMGAIRGQMQLYGFVVRAVSEQPPKCQVTSICQVDLKGQRGGGARGAWVQPREITGLIKLFEIPEIPEASPATSPKPPGPAVATASPTQQARASSPGKARPK